jgi:hypothetical protein
MYTPSNGMTIADLPDKIHGRKINKFWPDANPARI